MANPTSNFGWQMPTNTDLVTDLPADFETFGQAVDTSLAELKGGTTGQILSKTSNTDMDFTWTDANPGDITGITASTPLTGGGTSGAVTVGIQDATTGQKGAVQLENSTSSTSTTTAAVPASVKSAYDLAAAAVPKSLVDAAGDLLIGTANDTVGRLAIGTNGQVLKSNGTTATWGTAASNSNFAVLGSAINLAVSGGSTHTISGLSGYEKLFLSLLNVSMTGGGAYLYVRINGDTTSKYSYYTARTAWSASSTSWQEADNAYLTDSIFIGTSNSASGQITASLAMNGCNGGGGVNGQLNASTNNAANGAFINGAGGFIYQGTAVVSSITIYTNSTFDSGTIRLWGSVA